MENISNTGRFVRKAFAAAIMVAAMSSAIIGDALALDRNVVIVNDTRVPLLRFYASNVGMNSWGTDHLGSYVLNPGDSLRINLDDGSGYCMFDFRGEFSDGDVVENFQVNACEVGRFRFYD
jgi:hypothetical protein